MKVKGKEIKIIGHRGAPCLEPENTLLSFKRAIDLGCEMIETDVRLSKDSKTVLIHDLSVNRTTDGRGFVFTKTLKELKKLNAGKGETIPTLEEAWDLIKGKALLNIEIKTRKSLEKILAFVKERNIENQILISSRYYKILAKIKKTNPYIKTGLITYVQHGSISKALKAKATSLHSFILITNNKLIKKAHDNNLKIYPSPITAKKDNLKKAKKLIEAGVDGIFLNDPSVIKKI